MSDARERISIRLEIDVPVGAAVHMPSLGRAPRVISEDPNIKSTDPGAGDTKTVRPRTTSATGCICAQVIFNIIPAAVIAKVYPEPNATPHASPPNGSVAGLPDATRLIWSWNDNQASGGGSALPLTDHLPNPPYPLSTFTIWYKISALDPWTIVQVQFSGRTGALGFCGGTGTGTGSGSGAGVQTDCCDDPLPAQLHVTITGDSFANGTYPLTYNTQTGQWESANILGPCIAAAGAPMLALICDAIEGFFIVVNGNALPKFADSENCSPFDVVFNDVFLVEGCGGYATLEFTL